MKFGVFIRNATTYEKMLELSRGAEELDYYGVFLNDHVNGFADGGKEPYLEAWTAMKAAQVPHETDMRFYGSDRDAGAVRMSAAQVALPGVISVARWELVSSKPMMSLMAP